MTASQANQLVASLSAAVLRGTRPFVGLTRAQAGSFRYAPAELAIHPVDGRWRHELYPMCDDIQATLTGLRGKGIEMAQGIVGQGPGCWLQSACRRLKFP
jgi:hypothetical protein